jgi:hypothetical protein
MHFVNEKKNGPLLPYTVLGVYFTLTDDPLKEA